MHAETHTQTQQQQHTDEPTIFHYLPKGQSTALCGHHVPLNNRIKGEGTGEGSWVVCPICEFICSMSDDKPRFKRWLTGTYQLEKNAKEHNHE